MWSHQSNGSTQKNSKWRILVTGPLSLGQTVLVADACHQVFEPCDPGSRLFSGARNQVQGLHVFSVVKAEAAVGVKAALCIALEDLRLLALTHLSNGVDGDWWSKREVSDEIFIYCGKYNSDP